MTNITQEDNAKINSILGGSTPCYYNYHIEFDKALNNCSAGEKELYIIFSKICLMWFGNDDKVYVPIAGFGDGHRTPSVEDFVGEIAEVLLGIYDKIENPLLKFRVADVMWINKKITKFSNAINFAKAALDGFCAYEFEKKTWFDSEMDHVCSRAISLCLSIKKTGEHYLTVIREKLHSFCDSFDDKELDLLVRIGKIFLGSESCLDDVLVVANKIEKVLVNHSEKFKNYEIDYAYDFLISYYSKVGQKDSEYKCCLNKGKANKKYAEDLHKDNDNLGKIIFLYDEAFKCFNQLPREIKLQENVFEIIKEIRIAQDNLRKEYSQTFHCFKSEPIDITEEIKRAKENMAGLDFPKAICRFVQIYRPNYERISRGVLKNLEENPILAHFPMEIYDEDRIVAKIDGIDLNDHCLEAKEKFQQMMVQHLNLELQLCFNSCLFPSFLQLTEEHKVTFQDCFSIVSSSKFVPQKRQHMYAKGIFAGFVRDFQVAAVLLIPQIENSIRVLLKKYGEDTSIYDAQRDIQSEIGLSSIVANSNLMKTLFDKNLCFIMKAFFGSPPNYNLRNRYAHGLVDDFDGISLDDFMVWYIALKLIVYGCANEPEKFGLKLSNKP
jgi:hypothetical protein